MFRCEGSGARVRKSLASTYVLRPLESYVLLISEILRFRSRTVSSELKAGPKVRLQKSNVYFGNEVQDQGFTEVSPRAKERDRGEQSSGCETGVRAREEENRGQ